MIVSGGAGNSVGELSGTARVEAFRPYFRPTMLAGDFTITCWVRPQAAKTGVVFAATRADDRERQFSLVVLAAAENPPKGEPGLRLHFGLQQQGTGSTGTPLVAPRLMLPGRWHHLAISREGRMLRLFLDGREAASGIGPDGHPSFTRMLVGRLSADGETSPAVSRPFNGSFDELALFERALGGDTIADLAKAAGGDDR
jgi:sialidase-1